jgi:hypothetical protein
MANTKTQHSNRANLNNLKRAQHYIDFYHRSYPGSANTFDAKMAFGSSEHVVRGIL